MSSLRRRIRLVVFDLDGTLTPVVSLWRYLHEAFGTWDRGTIAAQRYKRGEISYREWAEIDAGYWAGLRVDRLQEVISTIPCQRGAREVFRALKQAGARTAIVSAGLSMLTDKVAEELGADVAVSNDLQIDNGTITGEIVVKVAVDRKREIIEQIAAHFGIPLTEVALVGDRQDDLSVSECLRIAFKPKDEAARQADFIVQDDDLSRILEYVF